MSSFRMAVINDSLVNKCLIKMLKEDDEPEDFYGAEVEFNEVTKLRLSFESICKIDNLENFAKLQSLSLDNNKIEKMCNLDTLVNLQCLDLSFNKLTVIEGLEKLTKLTDLSLFNNKIKKIDGINDCKLLNLLSLGNNLIDQLDNIKYLRSFKDLEVVNLAGNPVSKHGEYKAFTLAYLKHLKYLDYSMVDSREVENARDQYQDFLIELEEKEGLESKSGEMELARFQLKAKVRAAHLENTEIILELMLKDDTEVKKISCLPFYADLFDEHEAGIENIKQKFKDDVIALHDKMNQEVVQFSLALDASREYCTQNSIEIVKSFDKAKDNFFKTFTLSAGVEFPTDEWLDRNEQVGESLLKLEHENVDDFDSLIDTFDTRYDDMKISMIKLFGEFFREVEDKESIFNEDILERSVALIDKFVKEQVDEDEVYLSNEAKLLLQDKEGLMSSIATSFDIHIGKLLAIEDDMREKFVKNFNAVMTDMKTDEKLRHRKRVDEIRKILTASEKSIETFRQQIANNGEDEFGAE